MTATTSPTYRLDDWQGGHRTQPQEFSYEIEDITGQIPPGLTGTLFRNGPGRLDRGGQRYHHPFDGDGMISQVSFQRGRAFYRNRYVQTQELQAEQRADKILYRGVFGTLKPGGWLNNMFDLRLKNIANTNVIYWGDKLLALWEAAQPYQLDPNNLDTLGLDDLQGTVPSGYGFSAHPRLDPQGLLVNFGVKAGPNSQINLYEFNQNWQLVRQHQHPVNGFAFLHDFILTENYYIFFQNPVNFNPLPYVLGWTGAAQCLQFDPEQPTRILVIPRNGGAVRVFLTDSCFVFHHANGYEQGDELILDSICYRHFPTIDQKTDYQTIDFATLPSGQLKRFRVNLTTHQVTTTLLLERCCEFPQVHPQRVGREYQRVYLGVAADPVANAPLQGIMALDVQTGQQKMWQAGTQGFVSEPVFVSHGEGEDQGWLITFVYNSARQCSDIVILNAADMTAVATLHLKHHIPYGLHGSFTPVLFDS
ncbi:Retinal pigment epithelial membrane protein [Gloeomargarita lithophora Alchichica-D10]|uniref:Retinal pigment epithelial membrane protein n=1 Tax=Gloeomargarita lithophora Alchichica-D10 TaxID=1188229 RepID=A0A1J0ABD6_9CYAN|nr:carotenoid oxygenase family protein [Gloeomargarita lithophora]APB33250.1 Retinal pigment epithelial membrane protein [Gloeomargarita lithophora Alchichica-D10]